MSPVKRFGHDESSPARGAGGQTVRFGSCKGGDGACRRRSTSSDARVFSQVRLYVRGCLCLGTGIDVAIGHTTYPRAPPTAAPSPPLHDGCHADTRSRYWLPTEE